MARLLLFIALTSAICGVSVVAQSATDPYIFITGPWGACKNTVTGSTTCGSPAAEQTRQISCIRRGSFGLKLPHSFCSPYGSAPTMTKSCYLPPCSSATAGRWVDGACADAPQPVLDHYARTNGGVVGTTCAAHSAAGSCTPTTGEIASSLCKRTCGTCTDSPTFAPGPRPQAPMACQDNVTAFNSRIHKAIITVNSAGEVTDNTGSSTQTIFPQDFKLQVIQAVRAGPVVVSYTFYSKDSATPIYQGEKVGQAMTNNSYVYVQFEDLAQACDTATKGKGTFAITMNNVQPPISMSMDPNYFSRQKIVWYWPTSDFPAESPDTMMVNNFPYTIATNGPSFRYMYGENPAKAATYPTYMDLRYLVD